jgi:hypothetical protein
MLHSQNADGHIAQSAAVPPAEPQPDVPDQYEPPAIIYRAPLEVTAAFCDPSAGGKTAAGGCFMVINS